MDVLDPSRDSCDEWDRREKLIRWDLRGWQLVDLCLLRVEWRNHGAWWQPKRLESGRLLLNLFSR